MQRSLMSIAVMASLAITSGLSTAAPVAKPAQNQPGGQVTTQLPRNAVPTHYAVSLTPDAAHSTFSASVTIALTVTQATDSLTLNAADLAFSAAAISSGAGQAPQAAARISANRMRIVVPRAESEWMGLAIM